MKNYFWIDAICINQYDFQERSEQVKLMSTIYSSATCVYAWLGEEDDNTLRGFTLIQTLTRICIDVGRYKRVESLRHITPSVLKDTGPWNNSEVYADYAYWDSLISLFQRSYFTRAWIIQEISLSREILAICGSHSINWRNITIVSEFLTVTTWTRWISNRWSIGPLQAYSQPNHAVPNLLAANKEAKKDELKDALLYSLIRFRRFRASDPRDKVFALLGIVKESIQGKDRFNPAYERSTEDVYTQTAIQILEDSNNLLLLAHVEGEAFRQFRSLPSWVPDWSCERVVGLGVTGYRRYSASGDVPRSLCIDEHNKSLGVKGVRLDDIMLMGESKQDILSGKPFPRLLSIWRAMPEVYHTSQTRLNVLWRTLVTDTAGAPPQYPAPKSYGQAYVSWMASLVKAQISPRCTLDPRYKTALEALIAAANSQLNPSSIPNPSIQDNDDLGNADPSLNSEEYEVTFSHALHLRPFLTRSCYVGVGSESLREHDSVWIIPGSRVPLILREVNIGTFQVIGGAYVHGFMKGEALKTGPAWTDIILV
ncbi:hypothetical protein VB005_06318 [Metarhizium brunneum]